MQSLDFTTVNSPSATDTKFGTACEYLQPLEIRITALYWFRLLRNMVMEKNLRVCEGNCLE